MLINGRKSPWHRPVVGLLVAAALFLALLATETNLLPWGHATDLGLHTWVVAHRQSNIVAIAAALTSLGTSWVTILAVALVAFAAASTNVQGRLIRAAPVIAVMASGVLCRSALATIIARPRPARHDWAVSASGLSFPSGHDHPRRPARRRPPGPCAT